MVNGVQTWWLLKDGSLVDTINWAASLANAVYTLGKEGPYESPYGQVNWQSLPSGILLRTVTITSGAPPGSITAWGGKLDRWGNPHLFPFPTKHYLLKLSPYPLGWDMVFNPPYSENGKDSLGRFLLNVSCGAISWTEDESFTVTMEVEFRDGSVIKSNTIKAIIV